MWDKHKQWLFAVIGAGMVGNSGFVLSAALNMATSNLPVLAQSLFLFFLPGVALVAYAVKTGSRVQVPEKPTFSSDMQAIEHLAENCKGCKKAQAALEVITISTTQGLFKDA